MCHLVALSFPFATFTVSFADALELVGKMQHERFRDVRRKLHQFVLVTQLQLEACDRKQPGQNIEEEED